MAKNAIVFACANPVPEIWPWEAEQAGARIVATGRSDFPNQLNNSLGFPGIFRGVLDVQARSISDEIAIAAALELARCAEERGLAESRILPRMDDIEVHVRVAVATAMKAQEQGLAGKSGTASELHRQAANLIRAAREGTQVLMREGLIPPAPVAP
jgi:malate dehydrogenase (oxaloacetate-decarboxylating)